jgi:hypothetical protein
MTDLLDLKPKRETTQVLLKHPLTGEHILKEDGTEMSIEVYGSHTRQYKDAIHDQSDARLERASKAKDNTLRVSSRDVEKFSIELAAKLTASWDIVLGGKVPPVKDAEKVYDEFSWIRAQVLDAVEDFEAFMMP